MRKRGGQRVDESVESRDDRGRERIQKLLSAAGIASRRQIEGWIAEGRLHVNGVPARVGQSVTGAESFQLDGRPLRLPQRTRPHAWLAYHKPEDEICTQRDPEGRPTVFQALPRGPRRWVSVGRLDVNTSGLLLFTTDGALAHRLMHPSGGVIREYAVRVLGEPTPEILRRLTTGVELEDGTARFESVQPGGGQGVNTWYHVRLAEGRTREVRRLWESQGLTVSRLIRTAYGPIRLPRGLRRGTHRPLTPAEVRALYAAVGQTPPMPPPTTKSESARGPRRPRRR